MNITISPTNLCGEIPAIASKSCAHRLLICAALADGETLISCKETNKDIDATAECLRGMGAEISYRDGLFRVKPVKKVDFAKLDCGESGSTLRFLLPVVCALGQKAELKLHGRLPYRPMEPLWSELIAQGASLRKPSEDVISVDGKLVSSEFTIAADVSSQYISGLLFALPLMGGGKIYLQGKVESEGYITMTREALHAFGVETIFEDNTITVHGAQYHSPREAVVEGDWSNAAFWLAADVLSDRKVSCTGLNENSSQGDRAVVRALEEIRNGKAIIDAGQIPDLVPILSVVAALTPDETRIINAGRLRLKESDRLQTVREMLTELGGNVTETEDGLIIMGKERLRGGMTHSRNDHRIAMSAAVAAIGCETHVTIECAEAVEKSYPAFFSDYAALGGCVTMEESV